MKIQFKAAILSFCAIFHLHATDTPQASNRRTESTERTLNAIILFEKGDAENAYTERGAMTLALYEAIKSQSAPIFVSGALLHALYEDKRAYEREAKKWDVTTRIDTLRETANNLKESREQISQTYQDIEALNKEEQQNITRIHELEEQANDMRTKISELQEELLSEWEFIWQYCASRILTFDQWSIYKHPRVDAYLLIPHTYEETVDQRWNQVSPDKREKIERIKQEYNISERELKLGFRVDHSDVMQKITSENHLYRLLKNTWGTVIAKRMLNTWLGELNARRIDLYTPLTSFFVSHEENDAIFGTWNIYLDGHGYPPLRRTSGIDKLLSGVVKPLIAGMSYDKFHTFLQFLQTRIQTNFLYWNTCYGGGKNLDFAKNMLLHLNGEQEIQNTAEDLLQDIPSRAFVAASGALTDASAPASSSDEGYLRACLEDTQAIHFKAFFDALTTYAHVKAQNKEKLIQRGAPEPLEYPQFLNKLLWPYIQQALRTITPTQEGEMEREWVYSAPRVYIPGQKGFELANINSDYLSLDKLYLLRNYGTSLSVDNKQAVLLHENVIENPLIIRSRRGIDFPWFISLISGNAMHTINTIKIESPGTLAQLLYDSFFSTELAYDKLFHIKELTGDELMLFDLGELLEIDVSKYSLEDMLIYVTREQVIYESTQREHRAIFTLRHNEEGERRYIQGKLKNGEVVFKEITEKQAQKHKKSMLQRIAKT